MIEILDVTNHVRKCSLYSLRRALEKQQKKDTVTYNFVAQWLLKLEDDHVIKDIHKDAYLTGRTDEYESLREQGKLKDTLNGR